MGHDTFAYKRPHDEVAYLHRSMGNEDARTIYRLLGAEEYDAGVSGDGSWATFYRDSLEKAISQAAEEGAAEDVQKFLRDALAADPGDDGIIVRFG